MKIKYSVIPSIIIIFIVGCNSILTDSDGIIHPLEDYIHFKVYESEITRELNNESNIILYACTEKIYPCCNYEITNITETNPFQFTIRFKGIYKPEICLTALGPAVTRINLPFSEGEYDLNLCYKDIIDKYRLEITDSLITVIKEQARFTIVEDNPFVRP